MAVNRLDIDAFPVVDEGQSEQATTVRATRRGSRVMLQVNDADALGNSPSRQIGPARPYFLNHPPSVPRTM